MYFSLLPGGDKFWLCTGWPRHICSGRSVGHCFLLAVGHTQYPTASSSEGLWVPEVETPLGDMRGVLGARALLRVDAVGCM